MSVVVKVIVVPCVGRVEPTQGALKFRSTFADPAAASLVGKLLGVLSGPVGLGRLPRSWVAPALFEARVITKVFLLVQLDCCCTGVQVTPPPVRSDAATAMVARPPQFVTLTFFWSCVPNPAFPVGATVASSVTSANVMALVLVVRQATGAAGRLIVTDPVTAPVSAASAGMAVATSNASPVPRRVSFLFVFMLCWPFEWEIRGRGRGR